MNMVITMKIRNYSFHVEEHANMFLKQQQLAGLRKRNNGTTASWLKRFAEGNLWPLRACVFTQ